MKLSKETIEVLKTFSTINNGIMLNPGNFIMTRSVNGAVYAHAEVQDDIDLEVAIYDLNGFLSVVSLFEDLEISMNSDGDMVLKDKATTIILSGADPSAIVYPKKAINIPSTCFSVELSGHVIQQLKRVARGLLNIDTVSIENKDGFIYLNGYNAKGDTQLSRVLYSAKLGEYDGANTFKFFINMDNLRIQNEDHILSVWASGQQQVAKFESKTMTHVVAMEDGSRHDF
ncbi:DNA polymerase processivity factor [Pseudomonas phage PspYZU05]|uniref:Sliding clamp n=1 Tax=Pseudomonas phage PspYZU05 TaxID=1983556 RepID=A0A2U7NBR9_9CAUD|nr:DNA polymerase processivity factor [Pseudomonas phage PspYZU05]ASD52039.1 sliding clamp [Pseudomonas phage PspYZU05]